ncbi:MAG: hypothetical protein H6705_08535 [Myxococcales bacterium]|nr:hypothetical protein [Myxococcales bacterium]
MRARMWVGCLCLAILAGCGPNIPERLRVAVEAEPGANTDSPIALAVLVVYDEEVMRELARLKADDWFEQAEQRLRDNPDFEDFDLLQWEVMPGQVIPEVELQLQERPSEGLVFADYYAEGDHRIRFNTSKRIVIVLGPNDFDVVDRRGE